MRETAAGRRRLGRGLEALLGPTREEAEREGSLVELPIKDIKPNPFQPRKTVDPAALEELVWSIKRAGLLQPVVVRRANGGYELIAGDRRRSPRQQLVWERIPAVQRDADDRTLLTLALIETLQRDDLSPVDEARGYERLIAEFKLAQQDVADAVGRDRSTVANALRLLKLPEVVLQMLHEGHLSVGHARALLALEDPRVVTNWAREAVAQGLSVREVEDRVRGGRAPERRPRMKRGMGAAPEVRRVEDALRRRLGTDARVTLRAKGKGQIHLSFYSNEDLARLLELILGAPSTDDHAGRHDCRPCRRRSRVAAISDLTVGPGGREMGRDGRRRAGRFVLRIRWADHTQRRARARARARGVASPGREQSSAAARLCVESRGSKLPGAASDVGGQSAARITERRIGSGGAHPPHPNDDARGAHLSGTSGFAEPLRERGIHPISLAA